MRRLIFITLVLLLTCNNVLAGFNGYLKADTQVIVTIGPFVDVSDGFTPQTDIALSGDEAELLKHGSTTVVDISGATWAAVTNCRGYYSLTLTTSHTDTEGQLTVVVQDDSDCLPVRCTFMVLNDNTFEAFFENAAEILTVNTTQVSGTSQTANDMSGDIDDILTDTEAQDSTTEIRTLMTGADTPVAKDSTPLTAAEAEAEAVDALESFQLDHLLGVDTTVAADGDLETYCVAGSIMAHVMGSGADVTTYKASYGAMDNTSLGALQYVQLDHLLGIDTTVAADGDLETYCVAGSVMAHLMSTGADVTTFKASTDSQESLDADTSAILVDTGTTLDDFIDTEIATLVTGVTVSAVNADAIEAGDFKTGAIDADALATDFVTEIWSKAMTDMAAGNPSATATVLVAINWLYEAWRNQTWATSTEIAIYKDDASTPLVESTISDDGTTFKRQEMRTPD